MPQDKVFCGTCLFCENEYGNMGVVCSHPKNRIAIDTPACRIIEKKRIKDVNGNNDCALFTPIPKGGGIIGEIIYALRIANRSAPYRF
jgi:hypothetical protein